MCVKGEITLCVCIIKSLNPEMCFNNTYPNVKNPYWDMTLPWVGKYRVEIRENEFYMDISVKVNTTRAD